MRLKLGQCRCGEIIYMVEEAGLVWTADRTPLEADGAVQALIAGRELYRIRFVGTTATDLSPATPAVLGGLRTEPSSRPVVVQNHGCPPGAARALRAPSPGRETDPCPKGRETGVQGSARAVPAERVTPRRSRAGRQPQGDPGSAAHPVCDGCAKPMADGTYAAVELGDLIIWAQHVERCSTSDVDDCRTA